MVNLPKMGGFQFSTVRLLAVELMA
jgi:hypothetical protein